MRYKIVILIFLAVWAIIITRLYQLSVKSNFYYERLAQENTQRKQYIKPVRGEIFDRHGNLLAMNRIGFSIMIKPHLRKDPSRLHRVIDKLVETFPDLNKTIMLKVYRKFDSPYNHHFIKVVDFIEYAKMVGAYPMLSQLEDIKIVAETKRYYPFGKYAAHVVGYTGRANKIEQSKDPVVKKVGKIGKSGLERYYNGVLQGELGYVVSKVTATNKEVQVLQKVPPKDNKNIRLHLDIYLQKMIYERFKRSKEVGAAIVMKTTGEVLAAVSYPAYDPNLFVGGISVKDWRKLQEDLTRPFTNKFIHGLYPPGSTIKMGMALAFEHAQSGILAHPEYCSGHITLGKSTHKFRCWATWGHGNVGLRRAIRESCDVYFYNKSLKVGIDAMAQELKKFGIGVKTGIDLPREYRGIVPSKSWKIKRYNQPWYMGETVIAAIGQGYMLSTPLQIARYTALMATSQLVTPTVAGEVDGKKITPKREKIALAPGYIDTIRQGMYDVCNVKSGTAYKTMSNLPIVVAGKTGTSQVTSIPQNVKKRLKEEQLAYFHRSHAWLTTYAPYKNPSIVVTVLVEHGGHGGSAAGPIVADIYRWLYAHGYFSKNTHDNRNNPDPKGESN